MQEKECDGACIVTQTDTGDSEGTCLGEYTTLHRKSMADVKAPVLLSTSTNMYRFGGLL